jgi:hypothetical protein
MNDRIKQLAELSKSFKTMIVDGQMQSVLTVDPERFATMIVKECAKRSEELGQPELGKGLMKHFGVKE